MKIQTGCKQFLMLYEVFFLGGNRKFVVANLQFHYFVKNYSNFEPKKQGVLVTKGSFGRKNANF